MDIAYIERYRYLYEEHWWWRAREKALNRVLAGLPDLRGPVLDVGCGDGLYFPHLETIGEVWGVEPEVRAVSEEMLATGRIHLRPFDRSFTPDRRFGLVVMLDVLEHLDDPEEALTLAHSLTVEGGWLVLTVPAIPGLWSSHDDFNHHRTRYTRPALLQAVRDVGFTVTQCEYLFHWVVFAKLAQRVMESIDPRPPKPTRMPPRPINRFLCNLSLAEQALAAPMRLPFGTSLFLTARRP